MKVILPPLFGIRSILLRRLVLGLGLAGLATAACEDPASSDIRRWAHYWVERQVDTASADSLAATLPDSALLDSLSAAWTADEWLRFWDEVEKEQGRRRKDSDTAASAR